jgi:hypothetical protein
MQSFHFFGRHLDGNRISLVKSGRVLRRRCRVAAAGDVRRGHCGGDQPHQPRGLPRHQHRAAHHEARAAAVPAHQGHAAGHPVRAPRPPLR